MPQLIGIGTDFAKLLRRRPHSSDVLWRSGKRNCLITFGKVKILQILTKGLPLAVV
ncbi:MAG: hypothetical protein ABH891_00145 [Candidatus Omnitrophota bacterium]